MNYEVVSERLHICYAVTVTICTCDYLWVLLCMRFPVYLSSERHIYAVPRLLAAPEPNIQINQYSLFPQIIFSFHNSERLWLKTWLKIKMVTEGLKKGGLESALLTYWTKATPHYLIGVGKEKSLKELTKPTALAVTSHWRSDRSCGYILSPAPLTREKKSPLHPFGW